jgi:S-disulfanyl-L-cysteine oxidoreductase SoxD
LYKTILAMCAGGVLLVLAACLFLLVRGSAAKPAGTLETLVMTAAKHRLLVGNGNAKNPLPVSSQNVLEGRQNFSHYCYVCHGLDGQGTGVPFADAMSPPLPSLASKSVQSYSDGQLFWVIKNGLWPSGMPRANGILNDDEIWSIVTYIRHLPPAGSLPDPPAYSDEPCAKSSN